MCCAVYPLSRATRFVILRTLGGDVGSLVSRNKEFASNLQKAVEQAFVVRARQPLPAEVSQQMGEKIQ